MGYGSVAVKRIWLTRNECATKFYGDGMGCSRIMALSDKEPSAIISKMSYF